MLKYFVFFALFCNTAFAKTFTLPPQSFDITRFVDGDTIYITVKPYSIPLQIRFKCSDTFECGPSCKKEGKSQYKNNIDLGKEGFDYTTYWINQNQKTMSLQCDNSPERHGRFVCYILSNGENLNHLLIENGYAVASKGYCKKDEMAMMERARQDKKGLWYFGELENPADARKKK